MITLLSILSIIFVVAMVAFIIGLIIAIIGGSISLILEFIIPALIIMLGIRLIRSGINQMKD